MIVGAARIGTGATRPEVSARRSGLATASLSASKRYRNLRLPPFLKYQGPTRKLVNPGCVSAAGETPSSESARQTEVPSAGQGLREHGAPEGDSSRNDGDAAILAELEPGRKNREPNTTKR